MRYVTNPAGGENVLTAYPDKEYDKEFGLGALSAATVTSTPSVSTVAGIQGPLYRWVRINAVTEKSLNFDVDNDSSLDPGPIFYDGAHLTSSPTGSQALEITSLAVLPNGSQKIVQYIVAPESVSPDLTDSIFPAALTLDGNNVLFQGPNSSLFKIAGADSNDLACTPTGAATNIPAIGYTNNGDSSYANITATTSIPTSNRGNYTGLPPGPPNPSTPSVVPVTLRADWQTPGGLNALVQRIRQSADAIVAGPATGSSLPPLITSQPMTVVVDGDLDLNAWPNTGYGLLLVTGTLKYDPDAYWKGIVLVIGQGVVTSTKSGLGVFTGAVFVARTVDASNNPLPPTGPLGQPSFNFDPSSGGNGILFNSCWIKRAQGPLRYKVLSFREIPNP